MACEKNEVEDAVCFSHLTINDVENVLRINDPLSGERVALRECGATGETTALTRHQLRGRVVALARSLRALGVTRDSRVVVVAHNDTAAVVAALATLVLGATFSSAAPEMGVDSIVARFGQLAPPFRSATWSCAARRSAVIESPQG